MKNPPSNRTTFFIRFMLKFGVVLVIIAMLPLLLIAGCQSRLIYHPRTYAPGQARSWAQAAPGKIIDFQTSQGRQRAFLQGNLTSPRNLWLVSCGNATVALEGSSFITRHGPPQDAWLLFDLPGYGDSGGSPNPANVLESWRAVVPLAMAELELPPDDPDRLRFFGQSLGGAACLIAASDFHIQRGVLISPFTSTMEMAKVLTGLPIGFLVRHRYDNIARLGELATRGAGEVIIVHGMRDTVIPVDMSRHLAARHPDHTQVREVPDAGHNDLQSGHAEIIAAALHEMGQAGR